MRKKTIKATVVCMLCLLCNYNLWAQDQSYKANYKISVPKEDKVVSAEQYDYLTAIVKGTYTSGNYFSDQSPFLVKPTIRVISEKIAGEIKVIKVVKLEIRLTVEGQNDLVFNTLRKVHIITADDVPQAITKAIDEFSDYPKVETFFEDTNRKIVAFYQENCDKIVSTVKVNIERDQFKKAFDYLRYVPETASCYKEVERLTTELYVIKKREIGKKSLEKAQAAQAEKDYYLALFYLKYIDQEDSNYTKASALIKEVASQIGPNSFDAYKKERLTFDKLSNIEKIKELANSYW